MLHFAVRLPMYEPTVAVIAAENLESTRRDAHAEVEICRPAWDDVHFAYGRVHFASGGYRYRCGGVKSVETTVLAPPVVFRTRYHFRILRLTLYASRLTTRRTPYASRLTTRRTRRSETPGRRSPYSATCSNHLPWP
jgi:hypothetical protein